MINNITIGIVTFKERLELLKQMMKQIASLIGVDGVDVIIAVNGNNEENMPNDYRREILTISNNYDNVYPIICPEFKSLAKLWNTITIFSKTEYNIILTDDLFIGNEFFLSMILDYINSTGCEFFTINNQFSHFVVTKNILHGIGYFDERFIAFGEEDGDMVHRHIEQFGERMADLHVPNFYNMARYDLSSSKVETHTDNKPRFNREFANIKYKQDPNGHYGMSPTPISKVLDDYQQYPYEDFFIKNKHNIKSFKEVIIV
jgi:hypothetical protein